ncbi:hypothetical protein [Nostoc sp.]|uniref:hypothetical protein n=1 Tax=Nostoc sp. TaxID=1180 RepID=UPI002FF8A44B
MIEWEDNLPSDNCTNGSFLAIAWPLVEKESIAAIAPDISQGFDLLPTHTKSHIIPI